MVLSLTPYDLPYPQNWVQNTKDQLRDTCCHLAIHMIENINKISFAYNSPIVE